MSTPRPAWVCVCWKPVDGYRFKMEGKNRVCLRCGVKWLPVNNPDLWILESKVGEAVKIALRGYGEGVYDDKPKDTMDPTTYRRQITGEFPAPMPDPHRAVMDFGEAMANKSGMDIKVGIDPDIAGPDFTMEYDSKPPNLDQESDPNGEDIPEDDMVTLRDGHTGGIIGTIGYPDPAGSYQIGEGFDRFRIVVTKKPKWFNRKMMAWLFGWHWIDR